MGLVVDLWATVRPDGQLWRMGGWLLVAGALTLMLAVSTGLLAAESVHIPDGAAGIFDVHRQLAFAAAALFAFLTLWRLGSRGKLAGVRRALFLGLYAVGVTSVLIAGWYGGRLVFESGVGVRVL
jgi:uncharacterized membrane protein